MDHLSKLPHMFLLSLGFFFLPLVIAQTETVYVTQISTVFTACQCTNTSPLWPTPLLPVSSEKGETLSNPTLVTTVLHQDTPLPTSIFPTLSVLSGALTGLTSSIPLASVSTPLTSSHMATSIIATIGTPISLSNGLGPLLSTATPIASTVLPSDGTSLAVVSSVGSPISLSNGIWPLLSAATSTNFATLTTSPALALSPDTGSSAIQLVSSSIAATAASSKLTTSGIPESLNVNLSAIASNTAIDSSAALISFGTSSPAVVSTILPPGSSRGTSSETLAIHSTVLLNGVSLTGATLLSPRSPTSCFTLPTPVSSMDMLAIAVVPETDYNLANPMIFSFSDNGTVPGYVSALSSGNPYVLDMSSDSAIAGLLGLQMPGDEALVFDGSGMSLYAGNCSTVTQVAIDNFYSQLREISGEISSAFTSKNRKRQAASTTNFTVDVAVDSYLRTISFSPNLTFGNTPCTLQTAASSSSADNITWTCMYPPPMGDTALCAASLDSWLNDITMPSIDPSNATEVLAIVGPFLALVGDSIMSLFPGADSVLGLGMTFMQQVEAATKKSIGDLGSSTCDVLHEYDSDDLVIEDGGPLGTQTIGSFMTSPPPAVAVNLQATATASFTGLPRRKGNPTDNFLKVIVTDFRSILGAFTSWLGGLHLLVEETGTMRLRPVAATPTGTMKTTSTAQLTSPSLVRIQVPTTTVVHALGDGWLSPSTYAVGPDTNTMSRIPTMLAIELSSTTSVTLGHDSSPSISYSNNAFSDLVDRVVAQLAAMNHGDAGVQKGHRWDLPTPQTHETGTITTGTPLGYDGHNFVVTTTITIISSEPKA